MVCVKGPSNERRYPLGASRKAKHIGNGEAGRTRPTHSQPNQRANAIGPIMCDDDFDMQERMELRAEIERLRELIRELHESMQIEAGVHYRECDLGERVAAELGK